MISRTRQSTPGLLEDRAGELGPRALALGGHVPDALRQREQLARRLGQVADVGRRAGLVGDDAHLVALCAEPQHRPDEVRAGPAEQPRAAHDPALAHLALALELRPAVDRERARLVGLDVRLALRAVEDVVGRVVDDRHAQRDDVARAVTLTSRAPAGSDSAPSTSVQAAACRTRSASVENGCVTSSSARVRASASGKASRSAAPSWPPAPVIRTRRVPTGSAISCSRGRRRAGRSTGRRARRGRPRRTPR